MSTNLALDDALIKEAVRLGKHKTKKEAVTAALQEYLREGRRLQRMRKTRDGESRAKAASAKARRTKVGK